MEDGRRPVLRLPSSVQSRVGISAAPMSLPSQTISMSEVRARNGTNQHPKYRYRTVETTKALAESRSADRDLAAFAIGDCDCDLRLWLYRLVRLCLALELEYTDP